MFWYQMRPMSDSCQLRCRCGRRVGRTEDQASRSENIKEVLDSDVEDHATPDERAAAQVCYCGDSGDDIRKEIEIPRTKNELDVRRIFCSDPFSRLYRIQFRR